MLISNLTIHLPLTELAVLSRALGMYRELLIEEIADLEDKEDSDDMMKSEAIEHRKELKKVEKMLSDINEPYQIPTSFGD